jgi:hypothetical protein
MKCPEHRVEYQPARTSYEQLGVILKDVEALRCPVGGEVVFTLEQAERMRERIAALSPRLRLRRKITRAAGKPSICLPEEIVKQSGLRIGQEVSVYLADKKRIVIEGT